MQPGESPFGTENPATSQPTTSGVATTSLIFGLLSFCLPIVGGLVAIGCGVGALVEIGRSQGRKRGQGFAIAGMAMGILSLMVVPLLLLPALQAAREAARRQQSSLQLKQIGLAMLNYEDRHRALPSQGIEYIAPPRPDTPAEGGQPRFERREGLSWRVRILPFLERQALYDQFDFNQPWDHPTNKALISKMPLDFVSPNRPQQDGKTVYLGVVYPEDSEMDSVLEEKAFQPYLKGTAFDSGPRRRRPGMATAKLADFVDGTSNTICVVEANADPAVIWTKPDDWELNLASPRQGLDQLRPGGFLALFADASVRFIPSQVTDNDVRRLMSRLDGERFEGPILQTGR